MYRVVLYPASQRGGCKFKNQNQTDMMSRRNIAGKMNPAEKAIQDAMYQVEIMPADPKLTEAVLLLEKAKNIVSDYIDVAETFNSYRLKTIEFPKDKMD